MAIISFAQTAAEDYVNFYKGQVATIILPITPDASKGMYFRIERWEEGKIVFEQELQPQAHVPYIIIPNEDFRIDPNTLDLAGLRPDTATIEGVDFIGWYVDRDRGVTDGPHQYFLLDKTPDCAMRKDLFLIHVGPLRAFFSVYRSYCASWKELEYVLYLTDGTSITTKEDYVTFTEGQMATIILPTEPDAGKGKYYRLDRVEAGQIVFEQELQPRAHVPYIIVPFEDFSINLNDFELAGLSPDTVSINGIRFIGSYTGEELTRAEDCYIDIIDKTPDCSLSTLGETGKGAVIGAIRAYLEVNPKVVRWDDPYHPGGTRAPTEKMEIVLKDGSNSIQMVNGQWSNGKCFDLSGKIVNCQLSNGKYKKGIYIKDGRKHAIK